MENQSIYYKIFNIQISPHNIDPARLLTIRLDTDLTEACGVGGHFPLESNDDSLPWLFFINPSSMTVHHILTEENHH